MPKKIILKLNLSEKDITKYNSISDIDYEKVYYPDQGEIHEIKPIDEMVGDCPPLFKKDAPVKNSVVSNTDSSKFNEIHNDMYVTTKLYSQDYIDVEQIQNLSKSIPYHYTNSVCWWCCHSLDVNSIPVPIPVKYNETTKKFKCTGIFCSFNCAKAYSVKMSYGNGMLLYYLYKKTRTSGKQFPPFTPAPDRELLTMFGGILSISEFRESCKNGINTFNILEYPIIYNPRTITHSTNTRYTTDTRPIGETFNKSHTKTKPGIKEPSNEEFPQFFKIESKSKIKSKTKSTGKNKSIFEMLDIQK